MTLRPKRVHVLLNFAPRPQIHFEIYFISPVMFLACGRVFTTTGGYSLDTNCLQCQSSFLEELDGSSNVLSSASALNSSLLSSNILNNEQSRRLANAAIMLRLLESQLRDELNSLQSGEEGSIVICSSA
jgi:hypothetical protein